MRTVRGTPECALPNGRRFTAIITHTCDDEDDPYVETTFVDVALGRIDVLVRPHGGFTTVFSIQVTPEFRQMFPRINAWFSMIRGRPFAVATKDVSFHETCMHIRIRGYFDTRFRIQFDESDIAVAMDQLAGRTEASSSLRTIRCRMARRTIACTGAAVASRF